MQRLTPPRRVYTTRETFGLLALIMTLAFAIWWFIPRGGL
jgi:hypothetical protein